MFRTKGVKVHFYRLSQHRGLLILKEVLRQASSSIKKQSYHHSQVAIGVTAASGAVQRSL